MKLLIKLVNEGYYFGVWHEENVDECPKDEAPAKVVP